VAIAGLVLVGYIGFLLIANYLSHRELLKSAIEQIRQEMTKRAVAVSYFSAERVNDLQAIAAGRELAFFYANKALGMSMKYGLSANIDEIKSSFTRLLREKKIGADQIYTRIDFISSEGEMHISQSSRDDMAVSQQDLLAFLEPGGEGLNIVIHRVGNDSWMIFSMPYVYKGRYAGQIITWVDVKTIYTYLVHASQESHKKEFYLGYDQNYLPLPASVLSPLGPSDLPAPDSIPVDTPYYFEFNQSDGRKVNSVVLKVPVDNVPLFIVAFTPQSELLAQESFWQHFLFLVFLSVFVLVGICFLLRIKDQNLILGVRLEEAKKREEAITQKNLELQTEIAEREEMELALRSSENKYRKLHKSMRDGFVSVGTLGQIIECNKAFYEMLGYQKHEMLALSYEMITPFEWHGFEKEIIENQVLPRGYSEIYQKEFFRKDGGTFPAELRSYSLTDEDGKVVGTWAICRDVSERKRAEEELKKAKETAENANQAKSEFLAGMSHELRTPLHQIIGFSELLINEYHGTLNEKQKKYINHIIESSNHLLSLINDILDISKVEAGKLHMQLAEVSPVSLLEYSLTVIQEKALEKNIELSTDISELPEKIYADERILKQILINLLSNAAKFTGNGGRISLSASRIDGENGCLVTRGGKRIEPPQMANALAMCHGEYIEVAVMDTGIGLAAEDLERIFEPFEQVDSSLARKHQGTGLGLALTREFVELHGGRIWAESEGNGKGSDFRFVIPVIHNPQEHTGSDRRSE
jgi:PAS domain S-box-containing protein